MKIYKVRNKVFSQLFSDKESAELFMKEYATSATSGLEIIIRDVLTLKSNEDIKNDI